MRLDLPRETASGVPTLKEWEEAWNRWDQVTSSQMISDYNEKPIHLRHPFIFYIGHLPAFCDIMLSKTLDQPLSGPEYYKTIFERGIDPDVDNPTNCHPHSEVPDTWPSLEEILKYRDRVRERIRRVYAEIKLSNIAIPLRRLGRCLHMTLEHELMHTETLTYMLVQRNPDTLFSVKKTIDKESCCIPLRDAKWIDVEEGFAIIGIDDDEEKDLEPNAEIQKVYGWDNEYPEQRIRISQFQIQHRPVTNIEYLSFLKSMKDPKTNLMPASFAKIHSSGEYGVKTVNGIVPIEQSMNWPVALNYKQALAYLDYQKSLLNDDTLHIPSEAELLRFHNISTNKASVDAMNIGFKTMHPVALTDDVHLFGSVWEWTSTVLEEHPGFVPSKMYPGYTADFFDSKHQVVKGGSWATHPRLTGKLRNFYHQSYRFAFTGVRLARNMPART